MSGELFFFRHVYSERETGLWMSWQGACLAGAPHQAGPPPRRPYPTPRTCMSPHVAERTLQTWLTLRTPRRETPEVVQVNSVKQQVSREAQKLPHLGRTRAMATGSRLAPKSPAFQAEGSCVCGPKKLKRARKRIPSGASSTCWHPDFSRLRPVLTF